MNRADSTRGQDQAQHQGRAQGQGQGFWAWLVVQVLGVFAAQFLLVITLAFFLAGRTSYLSSFNYCTSMIATLAIPTVVILVIVGLALRRVCERIAPLLTALVTGVAGMFLSHLLATIWFSYPYWPRIDWLTPIIILWPFFVSFLLGVLLTAVLARWPRVRMPVLIVLGSAGVIIGLWNLLALVFFVSFGWGSPPE